MKKILPIVVIILVLLGIGYFLVSSKKNESSEKVGEGGSVQVQKEQGNIFTSIKDAIAKSMSLKCEYPDEKGNKVISYIKGKNIRVVGYATTQENGTNGNFLMREDKMYVWDDKTKKGSVITLNVEQITGAAQEANKQNETVENMEKYKDYCKVSVVEDSMFEIPTDVQFIDPQEQLKESGIDLQELMKKAQVTPENEQ